MPRSYRSRDQHRRHARHGPEPRRDLDAVAKRQVLQLKGLEKRIVGHPGCMFIYVPPIRSGCYGSHHLRHRPARHRGRLGPTTLSGSITFPEARRGEFQKMAIGIPEINRLTATRPFGGALYRKAMGAEMRLPVRKLRVLVEKGNMKQARAVMGRDHAAGDFDRFKRAPRTNSNSTLRPATS